MCIVFTCGEHTFRKEVEGYNGLVCRCYNCGNYSASVIKSNPWFTFCFVVSLIASAPLCGASQCAYYCPSHQSQR